MEIQIVVSKNDFLPLNILKRIGRGIVAWRQTHLYCDMHQNTHSRWIIRPCKNEAIRRLVDIEYY